jgi:prevent-host-death family protein
MATSMSLAQVKAHLSEVVSRVSGQHERVMVTVHGTPSAVLVAPEDLESLEETVAILSDPKSMRRMARSEQEMADGRGGSEADLAAAMVRRRARSARAR